MGFSRREGERFNRGRVASASRSDYPQTLPGVVMWMDARRPRYSDLAGSIPASLSSPVRRVDLRVPLGSYATAANDTERPLEENGALNFHVANMMTAPCPAVTLNDYTFALNYTLRDLWYGTIIKLVGSIIGYVFTVGIVGGRQFATDIVVDQLGSILLGTSPEYHPILSGTQVSVVCRISATAVKVTVVAAGARTDFNIVRSNPTATSGTTWQIGGDQTPCAISQVLLISRAISDSENDAMVSWLTATPAPLYFPTTIDAVVITGDSISRGLGVSDRRDWWMSIMQESLCTTRNINVFNGGQSGDTIGFQRTAYPTTMKPFYNAARTKNIFLAPIGINNMRTMGQDGPTALAEYYSYLDLVKTDGFLPIACTVLPTTTVSSTVTNYFNTHVRAEWIGRGYSDLADVAVVPGLTDPNDTAIYPDGLHPSAAGNALMAPVYAAAVARVRG